MRDLNVSLRGENDHFGGVARATPRVVFGGPLVKDKVSFSEVFEYDVIRDPIRGLTWPRNEIKRQGFTSYSTLQAILSPRHVLTMTLNDFPQRTQFANINPLLPQSASSDYDRTGESASLSDTYSLASGALLHTVLTFTRFDSNAHGQGDETMLLTPEAWGGNYFNSWARSASQFEAAPIFQFAPKKFLGRHAEIRVGVDATHRSFRGSSDSHAVNLLREDGSLAQEIAFNGPGLLAASTTDAEEFVADHWVLNDGLAIDLGARVTNETVGRAAAFCSAFRNCLFARQGSQNHPPRRHRSFSTPGVPLLAADFAGNPMRIINSYDPTGQVLESQAEYQSEYVVNGSGPIASRIRRSPNTSARSFVSSAEIDRALWSGAVLKLGFLHSSSTTDLFVVNPILLAGCQLPGSPRQPAFWGSSTLVSENYNEAEATLAFHPTKEEQSKHFLCLEPVTRGLEHTRKDLYIPFEQPFVIRPNVYGVRPTDVPNRLVVWGKFRLPWSFILGPVLDVHTGFPYSKVDENQNYVGTLWIAGASRHFFPSTTRSTATFSHAVRGMGSGSRKVRLGLYMTNLTNHGNFSQVYNNVTSPLFGEFTGFQRPEDGVSAKRS